MPLRRLILIFSLLANGALFAAYVAKSRAETQSRETAMRSEAETATARAKATAAAEAAARSAASPAQAERSFNWSAIETNDLDELMRRLQAAGFTKKEIRLILVRQIERMTSPFATADGKAAPYWKSAVRTRIPGGEAGEEFRRKIAEQQKLLRKYVQNGDELFDDPEAVALARRRWGDLTADKLQAIATIEADFSEMNFQEWATRRARPGEETTTAEARRMLEQERLADIAKVLTPEEFEAYRLRTSPLRYQLDGFRPSEAEYKSIFAINKAFESRFYDSKLTPEARTALAAEMTAQVKAALGEERGQDFDAVVNHNSHDQTAILVNQLGLPARVAVEIRQAQQDFTQKAKDVRANTSLSAADRNVQLDALAHQAQTLLSTKLGAEGFEAYSDMKGEWLRDLKRKPDGT